VLVHLGNANYLQRYRVYVTHVEAWRQQFEKLESVDLRFDGQIIVNPDLQGITRQPALTQTAAKAALAAGVKNAALVNYEKFVNRPTPRVAPVKPVKAKAGAKVGVKSGPKVATKSATKPTKAAAKSVAHHTATKAKVKPVADRPAIVSAKPVTATASTTVNHSASAPKAPGITPTKPAPMQTVPKIAVAGSPSTAAGSQKKPSPAIAKETPQN